MNIKDARKAAIDIPYDIICTKEQLKQYYSEQDQGFFYRGEANAKWVCQSSLLRDYKAKLADNIGQASPDLDMKNFDECRRCHMCNGIKVLSNGNNDGMWNNAERTEIWLQHWDKHSTLIDFTRNKRYALFFATENQEKDAEYIRVISMRIDRLYDFTSIYQQGIARLLEDVVGTHDYGAAIESVADWRKEDYSFIWDEIKSIGYISPTPDTYNCKIERQAGVLVCLGAYRALSLEDAIWSMAASGKVNPMKDVRITLIHTDLIENIKQLLEKDKIDSDFIYCRDKKSQADRIKKCPWRQNESSCPAHKSARVCICAMCSQFAACKDCPCGFDK